MHTHTDNFYSLLIARRNTGNVGKYLPSQFWNVQTSKMICKFGMAKRYKQTKDVENVQIVRFWCYVHIWKSISFCFSARFVCLQSAPNITRDETNRRIINLLEFNYISYGCCFLCSMIAQSTAITRSIYQEQDKTENI